ncbi:MAG: tetratricopeptide repeat protein [Bryobacteraceae bacterium]|jgi:tetratricopeptide (TPR) repeat protein
MMKRSIFGGAVVMAAVLPGLMAQPRPKTQEEFDAVKAMFGAATADARIAAAENLLTKFADTQFKATALYFEAMSYEQKGDYDHSVVFGERTLEADPNHYQAMLMLALEIAQHTKEFDLDKAEKLAQVDKYTKKALELLKDAPKPNAGLTDDQWAAGKKDFESQAHTAMGMSALADKKYDAAEREFKTAIEVGSQPDPSNLVRLGKAYYEEAKYDDAIAQFDKVMATPDVNPTVRQIAQAERVRSIQKKGGAKPATPAAQPDAPKPETPKP